MNLLAASLLLLAHWGHPETISCRAVQESNQGVVPCSMATYRRPYTNDASKIIATKTLKGAVAGGTYNMDVINGQQSQSVENTVINIHIPVQGLVRENQRNTGNLAPNIGFYPWPYPTPAVLGAPFVPKPDPYPYGVSSQTVTSSSSATPITSQTLNSETINTPLALNAPTTITTAAEFSSISPQISTQTNSQTYQSEMSLTPLIAAPSLYIPEIPIIPNTINTNYQSSFTSSSAPSQLIPYNMSSITPNINTQFATSTSLSSTPNVGTTSPNLNSTLISPSIYVNNPGLLPRPSPQPSNINKLVFGQGLNLSGFLNATDLAILGCDQNGNC